MTKKDGAETVAEIRDLTISYAAGTEQVRVVDQASLRLRAGRALGLVGESGSGKSTVARTLLGHLRAGSQINAGQVLVASQDVFALAPEELRRLRGGTVALVSQNAGDALTPSMRVGDQVAEALRVHQLPAGRDRVVELLEMVRLPEPERLRRRYPHELSGGQQQRVAIAMALATDPDILVMDEPTTALDVITQAAIIELVTELREELGKAVLIVSHDLGVIAAVADDVAVMRDGAIIESGETARVLTNPEQVYTKQLLAAAPRVHGGPVTAGIADAAPEAAEPILRCRDIDIRYPGSRQPVVHGFGLELAVGESVAIVGESGSGKSTVAAALAGLAHAERGAASLHTEGREFDLLAPVKRRPREVRRAVQLIFQNADLSLNPRRSVGDAIARPLKVFGRANGRAETKEAVATLLTEVGLGPDFARRLPAQLSGGQRQRVGIARALAAQPQVLIADEITTALDVSVQAEVLELLEGLRRSRQLSSVFISHDLAVVRRIADRIIVMKDGRVVEVAPTEALFTDPLHAYTRTLLDSVLEPDPSERDKVRSDVEPTITITGGNLVEHAAGHFVLQAT